MENSDRDSKKDVGNEAYRGLMEDSKGGKITDMSPHDYILMLLEKKYHSLPSLNELKAEIIGEKMPFDEQTNTILKNFVNRIIDWQIAERQKDEAKKQKEKNERQERIEDIESVKELTLEKINVIDDLPGKYQKATEYFSPETMITQMHEATTGISQDYNELKAIRDALTGARQVIIELPSKKSKDISEVAMRQIQELLNQSKVFIKRYKVDPFVKTEKGTEINPKLFGSRGTLGNGLISVVLRHIITSVEEELNRINEVRPLVETQPEKTPVAPTSPLPQPVAYTKSQINKISEGLWGFFTNRMRLK
jgi:hypothetical protein